MAIYDRFSVRDRIGLGVAIKANINKEIFRRGLIHRRCSESAVLDIGPGDGAIADLAAAGGMRYVAVEGNRVIADRLRTRGFAVYDGYVPPMPDGVGHGYSNCFMLHVLEHMASPDAAFRLLEDIRARLVPGGTLIVATPDFTQWGVRFFDCDYTHVYPLTRRRISRLLEDAGFDVVEDTVYVGPFFTRGAIPLAWLARLVYPRWLDSLIGAHVPADIAERGLLTILPNLLVVGRKSADP